jgi:polygalacturonase
MDVHLNMFRLLCILLLCLSHAYGQHIARITKDTIFVVKGTTYVYSVDTHQDSGLVSTATTIEDLENELKLSDARKVFKDYTGRELRDGVLETGDRMIYSDGETMREYKIVVQPMALSGRLALERAGVTVNTTTSIRLHYTVGQRTPNATVKIFVPAGINITGENTTVNVIGRGDVKLDELATQYIGRVGDGYPFKKVGNYSITKQKDGSSLLLFRHLDLRPSNGSDLVITINNARLNRVGDYIFKATYTTAQPEVLTSAGTTAKLQVTSTIADFQRIVGGNDFSKASFRWSKTGSVQLLQSTDKGLSWAKALNVAIDTNKATATVTGLDPDKYYLFRLSVRNALSNTAAFYSGKIDVKSLGVRGDGESDDTERINAAIDHVYQLGGGTLLFSVGIYNVRTVHLKSNVHLYVEKGATIQAIKGGDAPETAWFSDKQYRSGLSPTDRGPYMNPENWMTKQDVGHTYFRNAMFFGERLDNIRIIGNGYITGNGNLVTGDRVMNNEPGNRSDKMFSLKLCTNIEIGGITRTEDLWYDSARDEPYYIKKDGSKDFNTDNMLHIDRGGHFVLLATGSDNINVHDTYFAKQNQSNVRDIYDFMQCNNVTVTNIYSKVSSDDIVKPGSDCSLGFTRKATNYKVRNVIGDTNCNLFQIGSETADDITDIHVDNIYVLGANKAGFSISTNDGAHIKDIHLNCGHTGSLHSRSKMLRTFSPFFISISNRGRILGAKAERYKFRENDTTRDELLVTNVNIGKVENIIINSIDVSEVYSGSSYGRNSGRWKAYDGSQRRASPIVAGYRLPDNLNFKLPDGNHTGYINNIQFNDVQVLVKGGNPASDTLASPPELGVGQYNVSNLKIQPAYGLWARHVKGLIVQRCNFSFEKPDGRYAIFLDDVQDAKISEIKTMKTKQNETPVKHKNSSVISKR